jgi:hypothetical protein
MAADVLPEFAVDAADAAQFPGGVGKLLDQKVFVHVGRLVGFVEAAAELGECLLILAGEQAGFALCHRVFPSSLVSRGGDRFRNSDL